MPMATKESHQRAASGTVERLLEVETICFSAEPAPTSGFAVKVTCNAKRSFELVRRRCSGSRADTHDGDVLEQVFKGEDPDGGGGGGAVVFPVPDPAALRTEAACRRELRRMLRSLPQLQALGIEWELDDDAAVVPGDVVAEIVAEARYTCDGDGRAFGFTLCVRRRVVLLGEEALLMACKDRAAAGEHDDDDNECAICFADFGDLGGDRAGSAVEMPACKHAYHRRCISEWFSKATTCPLCRDDVKLYAMREFLSLARPTRNSKH